MRNIKITLEYDGTAYFGWQVQKSPQSTVHSPQNKTIQETLERALRKILSEKVHVIASGRTDSGVHAKAQVANFKTKSSIPTQKLRSALNATLPDDIVITKAEEADLGFNSRFEAKSKVYRYIILNRAYPSALVRGKVYFCRFPLNVGLMAREARFLMGRHDFRAFCASKACAKSAVRTIKKISIKRMPYNPLSVTGQRKNRDLVVIDIEADGFLYNMVRNIVGTLIEIGRGRFTKGSMKQIMRSKDRRLAGPTACACGLCLVAVRY